MHLLRLASALLPVPVAVAWTTYVVPYSGGYDDTPALTAAFTANPQLATDATILFQQGVTYNILTPIVFPWFQNVIVSIQGNITYAADIEATQAIVASSSYKGQWFHFSGGSNVTLQGSQSKNWGWVNSNGQQWWNAMQSDSSRVNRPFGWGFEAITNGEVKYMKLWQPVAWSFGILGSNLHIHDNKIYAISNNSAYPANTDGFDVEGTNIIFEDNVVYNGDDCVAISSPSNNIVFRNSYCNGGHGLSVGGLGENGGVADVENILFLNVVMENSVFGARFKSYAGGQGTARNITWRNIALKKVSLPIYITQTYWDAEDGAAPNTAQYQSSTVIDTFTFEHFYGTIDDTKSNQVPGSTGKEAVIFSMFKGTSKAVLVKNITTTTVSGSNVMAMCDPSTISGDVGFKCWDGLFEPTAAGL